MLVGRLVDVANFSFQGTCMREIMLVFKIGNETDKIAFQTVGLREKMEM